MRWKKLGRVFKPSGDLPWMRTHAALPAPLRIGEGIFRVYISGRNERNQAQIGFFEIDLEHPGRISNLSPEPVIALGPLGAHDESGVTASCVVDAEDKLYQYYTGWSLGKTVPFSFHIGLAVSEDGGATFSKVSQGPVLGRNRFDPYLVASPSVLYENGVWRMWYVSGDRWEPTDSEPKHYYNIRYAESADGIDWRPTGLVCLDFAHPDEYAFGRPVVCKRESGGYAMWYCVRGSAYRLGYAESTDGYSWQRLDDRAGLDVSDEGWDSDMLAYPYPLTFSGATYVLYNGNDYGRTGVGLAVADSS